MIEHERPGPNGAVPMPGQPKEQADQVEEAFQATQRDLASRSKYGELREAKGGHNIPQNQPAMVVQAIKDVLSKSKSLQTSSSR